MRFIGKYSNKIEVVFMNNNVNITNSVERMYRFELPNQLQKLFHKSNEILQTELVKLLSGAFLCRCLR